MAACLPPPIICPKHLGSGLITCGLTVYTNLGSGLVLHHRPYLKFQGTGWGTVFPWAMSEVHIQRDIASWGINLRSVTCDKRTTENVFPHQSSGNDGTNIK